LDSAERCTIPFDTRYYFHEGAQMNSKGIAHEFVISLIIIIIGAVIIFTWLHKQGIIAGEDADLNLCRVGIAAQEKMQGLGMVSRAAIGTIDSPLKINCKRREVTIGPKQIEVKRTGPNEVLATYDIEGKPHRVYNNMNEQILNSYMAESMRRCWYMGLEGKKPIFNPRETGFFELTETPNICMICDQISVELPQNELPTSNTFLYPFLQKTKMPNTKDGLTTASTCSHLLTALNKTHL
jgi:hypothetical protein